MNSRVIIYMLSFVLAWASVMPAYAGNSNPVNEMDEAGITEKYPNAKIIHVTEENYPALAKKLQKKGYRTSIMDSVPLLAENDTYQQPEPNQSPDKNNYKQITPHKTNDCDDANYSQENSASDDSLQVMVDFSSDMMSSNGDSGKNAAVVFVFIGAVLLVVWTIYIFKYLYDISLGRYPCGWSEMSVSTSKISSDNNQFANFYGLNFKTGIKNQGTEFGLSAEVGHSDILLIESGSLRLKGLYWLLGPMLRWRLSSSVNPHYFQMEFLAGSTEHSEMGVIARASMGLRFSLNKHTHMSLNWGAMNINLKDNQGIINDREQYHILYGINLGFRF